MHCLPYDVMRSILGILCLRYSTREKCICFEFLTRLSVICWYVIDISENSNFRYLKVITINALINGYKNTQPSAIPFLAFPSSNGIAVIN